MPKRTMHKDEILDLIRENQWRQVDTELAVCHPADIADIIDSSPREAWDRLFSTLPDELKPDVLAELEHEAESEVLDSLSNAEISELVEEMAPDDAADLLGEMSEDRSDQVLNLMEEDESEDLRMLMEFDEDTAGGIMTTEVVSMHGDQTVDEAIKAIAYIEGAEPFMFAYIVNADEVLIGYVDIWELLREKNRQRPLMELCRTDCVDANVNDDQEDVAHIMSQYDITAIPVVNDEGRLMGRITADDVIDVVQEEASEDIFRLAGSDDSELESDSPLRSCMVRLPWLLITLLGGFITSLILRQFHASISEMLILAAFVPIVLAMGGNTGIQASTLVVRRIALRGMEGRSVSHLLFREILVGATMGLVCGLIIGLWVHFLAGRTESIGSSFAAWQLATVVGVALFSAMAFAAVFGAWVPILLNRAKIDPAVASGPFVTIANDVSALLIYFGVTQALCIFFL